MARADDDDILDIRFLLDQEKITRDQLCVAINAARLPDVSEIKEIFARARPEVIALCQL
jgi:hypothetical protein